MRKSQYKSVTVYTNTMMMRSRDSLKYYPTHDLIRKLPNNRLKLISYLIWNLYLNHFYL